MSAARGQRRSRRRRRRRHQQQQQRPRRRPAGRKQPRGRRGRCSAQPMDSRTLRQIRRDGKLLSSKAKGLMIHFVDDLSSRVSREAERLRRESRRPTISPEHMQAALRHVVPKRRRGQLPGVGSCGLP